MTKAENENPLASLNLGGLTKLEEQSKEKGVRRAGEGASFAPIAPESVRAVEADTAAPSASGKPTRPRPGW